jgi:hypothetical protein
MIEAPSPDPPRVGPLAVPTEAELEDAYADLRGETLTVPWAAELLGLDALRVAGLVEAGELLGIPGPWPMRQAHGSGLCYFAPGWQLSGRRAHPELAAVLTAAADAGWTSLDLHRFMTTPVRPGADAPAHFLRHGEVAHVLSLIRGEQEPTDPEPEPKVRRLHELRRLRLRHRLAA